MNHSNFFRPILCLLFSVLILLTGCQATKDYYVGNRVESNLTIPLTIGHSTSGLWQTFEMEIHYSAHMDHEYLDLSGQGSLGEHYRQMYDKVQQLEVYVFFLDGKSAVLKTAVLDPVLIMRTEQKFNFKKTLPLPPGTKAISFGYRGKVSSFEDTTYFYELPLASRP